MAYDHDTAPKASGKATTGKAPAADKLHAEAVMQLAQVAGAARAGSAVPVVRTVSAADGVVRLPAGATLDNVHADGRDLVIQLPDGSQIVVTDGAVTVPQLIVDNTVVSSDTLIALLVGNEPQPAAGPPASSGGNFETPLGDIGPGIGIGDLLPPTELAFGQPQFQELFPAVNQEPTVIIITPNNPTGATDVTQTVSEAGLPARGAEPAGTLAGNGSNVVSGVISFTEGDAPTTVTLNGQTVVLGQTIASAHGSLVITSVAPGQIGYTYTLTDNVAHDAANNAPPETFQVVVTDRDGDTATGVLTITVTDDAPIARADADGVAEDGATVANGNVVTGAFTGVGPDANTTDGVADTQGADGAHLTGVAVGSVASASGNLGAALIGTYGSLVLQANGDYVYTLNNAASNVQALKAGQTVTDTFTYTLTDGDGDTASTTLTITVTGSNDAPVVGTSTISVSEEGLPGGIADTLGNPDTTNAAVASGTLPVSDVDGDTLAITLQAPATALTSGGVAVTWSGVGTSTLIGSAGGVEVVRVTIGANGAYTVTLSHPIDHPAAGEDAKTFVVPVNVNDGTTTVAGSLTVNVEDDSPTVVASGAALPVLTVDESNLALDAHASFAGAFTAAFGADGAGSATYALGVGAGQSGLVDTASGQAVVLTLEAGQVVGRAGAGGAIVFTVTVAADGTVTLDQQRAVVHPDASNPDDAKGLAAAGLVTLTATLTDHDGDTAQAAVNIGAALVFKDDGPSVVASAAAPALVVDESNLALNATASVASMFTTAFGADGAGQVTYQLAVNAGASGLVDTASGQTVVLSLEAGQVVGRAGAGGAVVFTLALDAAGNVTLDQQRAVVHADGSNSNDAAGLAAANLVTVTATVTDHDGDHASATANLGQAISFLDDGPSIVVHAGETPSLTVDETTLATNATASFAANFTAQFGADGAGAVTYALGLGAGASGLIDTATGQAVVLTLESGQVVGRAGAGGAVVFTLTVDAAGAVTLDQQRALVHADTSNSNDAVGIAAADLVTLNATVTDKDGDHASAAINLGGAIHFLDDGPSISVIGAAPVLTVDETNLAANATASVAALFTSAFGADGAGALTYALNIAAGPSGLVDTASGEAVVLSLEAGQVVGRAGVGGPVVFTLAIDAAGNVTLDQQRAIVHADTANPNDAAHLAADSLVSVTATITDHDGDHAAASVNLGSALTFLDDGPQISLSGIAAPALTVDETTLATNATASVATLFTSAFGADGAGAVTYALGMNAGSTGLVDTATGQAVVLSLEAGQVVGRAGAGGAVVFTVAIDAAGVVTLDQQRAVIHADAANPNDAAHLSADNLVTVTATVTDHDGDHAAATANLGSALTFLDDGPQIALTGAAVPALTVDETTLAQNATASFAGLFNSAFGADGAGSSVFTLGVNAGSTGLVDTASGQAVVLSLEAGQVVGRAGAGGAIVFTVSVDAAGAVTLDQQRAIVHADQTNANDPATLSAAGLITLTNTVTDHDGDHVAATANIAQALTFLDDGPSIAPIGAGPALIVDETTLAGNATANFAGAFGSSFGADGAGHIDYALTLKSAGQPSGLVDTATHEAVNLVLNAGVVEGRTATTNQLVFTVSVNAATGDVTLDQVRAVIHADPTNPNDAAHLAAADLVALSATITDKDGDHAAASINLGANLTFLDDAPLAQNDANGVLEGQLVPALGNVLVNDAPGADGQAHVVSVAGLAGNVGATFATAHGTITLGANGDYTYQLNNNDPAVKSLANGQTLTDTIAYQMADADGDTSPAVLNITITGVNGSPVVGNAAAAVSEEGLPGGLADTLGNPDTTNATTASGVISVSDPDGQALTVTLGQPAQAMTSHGQPITWAGVGADTLIGSANGVEVVRVTIGATGAYTVTLSGPVDHANPVSEDALSFVIPVSASDGSETAVGALTVSIEDDSARVAINGAAPIVTVDETHLAQPATVAFAGLFNVAYGADGPNAANPIQYMLGIAADGAPTGLIDTASGQAILLHIEGGQIVGRAGPGAGPVVFTISIDANANVTLDQLRAVVHPDGNNPNDPATLSAANLVSVIAVARDGDGDIAGNAVNIGQNFVFLDDGPAVNVVGVAQNLVVDETNLSLNSSAAFASLFNATFGADGPAAANALTYALGIQAGPSGLVDTPTHEAVNLVLNAGVVEGRTATSNQLVFTLSVDANGVTTLDQIRAVVHADASAANEPTTLAAANLVTLTVVATDHDGDHAAATVNLGQNLVFLDDAPSIAAVGPGAPLTVDESNLALNASGSFAAAFSTAFGADGAGHIDYALVVKAAGVASGLVDTATGEAVNLVLNAGVVEGRTATSNQLVFTLSADQNGVVTLDQLRAVVHGDANNPNDAAHLAAADLVSLVATITDGDGDHASAAINLGANLTFLDDGPSISAIGAAPALVVDESNLALNAQASIASLFGVNFGADGAGSVAYGLNVVAGPSGLIDTATGQAVVLSMNAGVVEGRTAVSGALVFTVSVSPAGVVTLDQIRAVVHPDASNANDSVTLSAANLVTATATVTDHDGDHAAATINLGQSLTFLDDGPTIAVSAAATPLVVDETTLAANATTNVASLFTAGFGADGAGQVAYSLSALSGASGLVDTATGQSVVLSMNAGVVEGRTAVSNQLVFTVSVNAASGDVTLDQIRAVVHPNTANPNDAVTLSAANLVSVTATVTDHDGDHASATVNLGQSLTFLDDASTLGAFGDITIVNTTGAIANGTFAYSAGADGYHTFNVTGPAITGITYTTVALANGVELIATADADGAGGNPAVTVFTYTVLNDGTTQFQLVTPQAASTTTQSLLGLSAGGPSPFLETPDHRIEFTGSGSGVNSSSQGFGVANQFVGNGESFSMEFHNPGAAGDQAPTVNPELVSAITLKNDNINGSLTITWTAHNDVTGQTQTGSIAVSGTATVIDPTIDFNRIDIVGTAGSGQGVRFTALDITKTILPADVDLAFQISAVDGDGDTTSSQTQTVHVDATPPIVLDLNGNGLEFQSTAAGVTYDYNGDGHAVGTAWVGSGDGILAYDGNGDSKVTGGEINFALAGGTDLEGLRAQFDSNHDGKLTAADADFAKFGVWQDANSNGVTDAGEFKSLAAMGITGIDLTSDGKSFVTADGQVLVSGQTTFTRADGSTGAAGDVSFATREIEKQITGASVANTLVAAALVAAEALAAPVAAPEDSVKAHAGVVSMAVAEVKMHAMTETVQSQSEAHDVGLVRTTNEADAGPSAAPAHANENAPAHAEPVFAAPEATPSDLAHADAAPVHAPVMLSTDSMPMISAQMALAAHQGAPVKVEAGHPGALAAVLADALGGGANDGHPTIDNLLANLPAPEAQAHAQVATVQAVAEHIDLAHFTGPAPVAAYELATMAPDTVTPLANG